jgi:hypothetical protein
VNAVAEKACWGTEPRYYFTRKEEEAEKEDKIQFEAN